MPPARDSWFARTKLWFPRTKGSGAGALTSPTRPPDDSIAERVTEAPTSDARWSVLSPGHTPHTQIGSSEAPISSSVDSIEDHFFNLLPLASRLKVNATFKL
ncbi:uncharacterized protein MELLADRAFT_92035 [Melampsora larici-populina 98AG31]|uniref:Uncharacterized protein n=1 Tax=Melampsora larici-populina (strain 98AG31 / pathotype 3-4-7) TaxID=747676 RepID=F4S1A6_MELLP|nr:uncharacterized protein MELLADRAFT_92035 [Melampsora larici-populina 98AG31]EGG01593.1 hypothetical protein MELLADRAFT_92035 [Melampsora larici-populina 98AG31]